MDDLTRIPTGHCPKVFIQRDYSNGTPVQFINKFPMELEGKVTIYSLLYLHVNVIRLHKINHIVFCYI